MTADKASISEFMPDLENGGAHVLPSPRKDISRRGSAIPQDKSPPPPPPLVTPMLSQVLHSGILKKKGTLATSKFYVLTKDVFVYFASEKDFKKGVSGTVTLLSTITNINSEKDALNYTVKSTNKSVQLFAASEAEANVWCERLNDAWTEGGHDDVERGMNGGDSEDDDTKMGIQDEDGMFSSILGEGDDGGKKHRKKRGEGEHKRGKRDRRKKPTTTAAVEDIAFDVDFETAFDPAEAASSPEKRNSLSSGVVRRPSISVVTSTRHSISLFSSVGNSSTQANFSPCPSPCAADVPSINNHDTNNRASIASTSLVTSPSSSSSLTTDTTVANNNNNTSSTITTTTTATATTTAATTETTAATNSFAATTTTTTTMPSTETFSRLASQLDSSDFADFDDMSGPSEVNSRAKSLSTSSTTTSTFHTIASTTPPSLPGSPVASCTSSAPTTNTSSSSSNSSSSCPSQGSSPTVSPKASSSQHAPHTPLPHRSSLSSSASPQNSLSPSSASSASRFVDPPKDNAFSQFNLMHAFEQSTGLQVTNWDLLETEFEEVEEVEDDGNFRLSSRAPANGSNEPAPSGKQGLRLSNVGVGMISLQDVLDDPEGLELLRKFAVETFDTENLDFLEEVQAYQKHLEAGDSEAALKQAKNICDQFVDEHGNKTLNINSKQRSQQLGMWKGLSPDFLEGTEFAVTEKEVKILLATNQFLRFKKTPFFVTWEKDAADRIAARQKAIAAKRSSDVSQGLGLSQPKPAPASPSTEDGSGKSRGVSSPQNGVEEHHRHHRREHHLPVLPPSTSTATFDSADFEGFEDLKADSKPAPAAAAPVAANGASVSAADMDAFFSSFENKRATSVSPVGQAAVQQPSQSHPPEDLATFLQHNELSSVYAILTANGVKDVPGLAASHVADLKRWGISSAHSVQLLKASRAKHGAPRTSLSVAPSPEQAPPPPPRAEGELASVMGNIDWIKELGMQPAEKEKPKEGRFSTFRRSLLGKKAPATMAQAAATAAATKQPPPPPLATQSSQSNLSVTPTVVEDPVKPYLENLGVADSATLEALEAHGIHSVVHLSSCSVNKLRAIGIPMGPAVKIARSFQ